MGSLWVLNMIVTDKIPLGGYSPLMTVSHFAELVGLSEGVVTGWVKRGYIPTIKAGRHRLINIAKLHVMAIDLDRLEVNGLTKAQVDKFAALSRNKRKLLIKQHGSKERAIQAASV